MTEPFHLCSLVIYVRPERRERFIAGLAGLHRAELHALEASGKGIVTLEADSEWCLARNIERLHELPGVVTVSLVYHHREQGLAPAEHDQGGARACS